MDLPALAAIMKENMSTARQVRAHLKHLLPEAETVRDEEKNHLEEMCTRSE